MNPSIDLRIRSMLRALQEAVIPALDPSDALAREQAGLLVGHLHALSLQHAHESRLDALERKALGKLGRDLLRAVDGGERTRAAAATLTATLSSMDTAEVPAAIDRLIAASGEDGSHGFGAAAAALTLAHAKAAALRGRSWFAAMGFDSDPGALAAIEPMLERFAAELEGES